MDAVIQAVQNLITVKDNAISILDDKLTFLKVEFDKLNTICSEQKEEVSRLQRVIEQLHNDQKESTKVSHIVSLEKENMRLKEDVQQLTARIEKLLAKKKPTDTYQEKKIKGISYYVSDDQIVYENNDGVVGTRVGQIVKEDGRSKVVWDS